MILNNLITSLLVKDYDEATRFYSGKLGFVVVEDVPMGPDRWMTIALPNSHEAVFALHVAKSDSDLALVGKQAAVFLFLA
jgi:catechol 2,3-dioxygenase-like lactoylglutathione lyase family enzyme